MMFPSWLGGMRVIRREAGSVRRNRRTRPMFGAALESLETRALLSAITVNSTADTQQLNFQDQQVTLREAVFAANNNIAVSPGAAAGEADADVIVFDQTVFGGGTGGDIQQTITLTQGPLLITDDVTIVGPQNTVTDATGTISAPNTLTIDGGGDRVFVIASTATSGGGGSVGTGSEFDVGFANITITGGQGGETGTGTQTEQNGGAVLIGAGDFTVRFNEVTISDSTAVGSGGGIFSFGANVTIAFSTISGNTAQGGSGGNDANSQGDGGGIFMAGGTLFISTSTISGNTAARAGGGIALTGQPGTTGGAGTTSSLLNSTVTNNQAQVGGGVIFFGGTGTGSGAGASASLFVQSTIIAGNRGTATQFQSPDFAGRFTSGGFNLIGNTGGLTSGTGSGGSNTGGTGNTSDIVGGNIGLGALAFNGGATQTNALLAGSVAIDAGLSSGVNRDQRGRQRPVDQPNVQNRGDGTDIGAIELQLNEGSGGGGGGSSIASLEDAFAEDLLAV